MTQPKVSTVVHTTKRYDETDRTAGTNALLKEAGAVLRTIPVENTRLRESNVVLTEKLSAAVTKNEFYKLAIESAAKGLVPTEKISSTADRWAASGHTIDHWKEVTAGMLNPSFASAEHLEQDSSFGKRSSDMDNSKGSFHNDGAADNFDHNSVTDWLRHRA